MIIKLVLAFILWLCKRLFFLLRKGTEIYSDRGHVFNLFSNSTEKNTRTYTKRERNVAKY